MRRAARAPYRRRPDSSTLGCVSGEVRVYSLRSHQQPSGASALLGKPKTPRVAKHRLREQGAPNAALRGWHPGHTEAKPHSQFHGRAAHGRTGSLVQRRAGGARRHSPRSVAIGSRAAGNWSAPLRVKCQRSFPRASTQPNRSFNRSANGMAPCPRGSACLSSASRARRHAVVARLTLR